VTLKLFDRAECIGS